MKITVYISFLFIIICSCSNDDDSYTLLEAEEGEEFSGGETTLFDTSPNAFDLQAPNLEGENTLLFFVGNSLFNQSWVSAPASTTARDGLGPLFNATACSTCHGGDGRGRAPEFDGELNHGLLLRLSTAGIQADGSSNGDPIYGGQLQDQSILGIDSEGGFTITYEEEIVTYPDGTVASLRIPTYRLNDLAYGNESGNLSLSPRVANQMVGMGLLEAIPESTLRSFADPTDTDGNGISGKLNMVWDVASESLQVGRFGWKSNQPSVRQQIAAAFAGDLGITTTLFPEENCPPGIDCTTIPNGGSPELPDDNLGNVTLYSSSLAVPGRRDVDNQDVLQGKALFNDIQCAACHIPRFETGSHPIPALENQTIRPYTDLLLHDMGEGLSDNAPDFEATGSEWRTAPLWGIGLIETVNRHTNLLHDGRARNIEEAILWHGGEAEQARTKFMTLEEVQRQQVLLFLNSL